MTHSVFDFGMTKMFGKFPGKGLWEIERRGSSSRERMVYCQIFLPVLGVMKLIHENTIVIGDELLTQIWGIPSSMPGFQHRTYPVKADTWTEAFTTAYKWMDGEAKKLQDAINTRVVERIERDTE